MVNSRQLRVIGLAAFVITLLVILYNSNLNGLIVAEDGAGAAVGTPGVNSGSYSNPGGAASPHLAAINPVVDSKKNAGGNKNSNLIESKNNDKQDEAINQQISKLSGNGNNKNANDNDVSGSTGGKALSSSEKVLSPDTVNVDSPSVSAASAGVSTGKFDAAKALLEIRSLSPMTIFSKTYCPYSKRIKSLLADNYEISPKYYIVELDKHSNGAELQEYLAEVTGRSTVPNVLIGASLESRGGADDFIKLHKDGTLAQSIQKWGNSKLSVKKNNAPSNA